MSVAEPSLVDKVLAVDSSLAAAGIRHAFGGALALAFYTHEPRATADIDVNIALDAGAAGDVFDALPAGVTHQAEHREQVRRDEQVRLWWGRTPIDLFFRASEFHRGVAERAELHDFAGRSLPFVAADDLAVFKALFDRPKDWLDIAEMVRAASIETLAVADTMRSLLGADARVDRLVEMSTDHFND